MRVISMFFLSLLLSVQALAGGKITGVILDEEYGDPVIGAIVVLKGTIYGAASDVDGKFTIQAPTGAYEMEVKYASYEPYLMQVRVENNETAILEIKMKASEQALAEVVIVAKANKESETALLAERKESTEVVQKMGAQEMSRKGVSDAAEGLTKVVGVSTSSSKVTVVRGLGDRYNIVTVNGLPIPSTNPDLKVLPLDIFPATVIKNLGVSKSYTPQNYGDFAGGAIDITTKDYAEKPFVSVGLGFSGNTITTGKPFLVTPNQDMKAKLGFASGDRALPTEVAQTKYYDSREGNVQKNPFNTGFSPETINAGPNYKASISAGNFFSLKKAGSGIGYFGTLNFSNDFRYSPGITALYNAQQSPRYHYATERYDAQANTTGLINLSWRMNSNNTIAVTSLYVNDASNTWISMRGKDNDLGEIYSRRNTYIQNTLFSNQFLGKHQLSSKHSLNWGASYSKTIGNMPDRLQNTFRVTNTPEGDHFSFAADAVSNNQRFFGRLNDNEYSGKIEYEYKSGEGKNGLSQLTTGFNTRIKDRVFNSRSIDMKIAATGNPVDLNDVDKAFEEDRLGDGSAGGTYKYIESYYAPNDYEANLAVFAGYANSVFQYEKWQFVTGIRVEHAQQLIYYKKGYDTYDAPFREAELSGPAFMPAVTVKRALGERANLMFAGSRTITRPQFVEVGPFRYNESFGTQEREGNPLLENGINYNADLKYEFYPSPSEIFSVNALGKYMSNPIELVIVASADPLLTYVNTDRAYVAGLELEYSRNLGKWLHSKSGFLRGSSIGANASYLYSQIQIDDLSELKAQVPVTLTNTRRPLMGASPYLLNLDYSYRKNWGTEQKAYTLATITYNIFGKRVFAAGSQGAGDIYEMPVGTLDFTIINQLKNGLSFTASASNLLNPYIVQKQYFMNDQSLDVLQYKRGIRIGLGLSYRF